MRVTQQQVLNALGPKYAAALQVVASNDAAERKQLYAALKPTFNDGDLAGIPTPTLRKLNREVNGNHPVEPVFDIDGAELELIPFMWGKERAK